MQGEFGHNCLYATRVSLLMGLLKMSMYKLGGFVKASWFHLDVISKQLHLFGNRYGALRKWHASGTRRAIGHNCSYVTRVSILLNFGRC